MLDWNVLAPLVDGRERSRAPWWPQSHHLFLHIVYNCVVDKMAISFTFDGGARRDAMTATVGTGVRPQSGTSALPQSFYRHRNINAQRACALLSIVLFRYLSVFLA